MVMPVAALACWPTGFHSAVATYKQILRTNNEISSDQDPYSAILGMAPSYKASKKLA